MTQTAVPAPAPRWQGINHLALVTTDMDATVRFYHGTLGARLVSTIATPAFRHYFFEFGAQCTVAFFEYTDTTAAPFTKAAGVPDPRAPQFDHLALNLPDEKALHELRRRLISHGCEVSDVVDHSAVRSVYFTDPNGIALEACWWVHDPTGQPADHDDLHLFADPDPVLAVRELARDAANIRVPSGQPSRALEHDASAKSALSSRPPRVIGIGDPLGSSKHGRGQLAAVSPNDRSTEVLERP